MPELVKGLAIFWRFLDLFHFHLLDLVVLLLQIVKLGDWKINEGFKDVAVIEKASKVNWEEAFWIRSEWGRSEMKQLFDYIEVSVATSPMQGCEEGVLVLQIRVSSIFEKKIDEFSAVLCFAFVFEHAGEVDWSYAVLCGSVEPDTGVLFCFRENLHKLHY